MAGNRAGADINAFGRRDQTAYAGDLQCMRERGGTQIGADEHDYRADLGEAEPDREIFDPIAHQECDGVALRFMDPCKPATPAGLSKRHLGASSASPVFQAGCWAIS